MRDSTHRENDTRRRDTRRPRTGQSASEFTVVFIRFSLSCVAMQALPFQGSLSMSAPVDCSRSRNSASLLRLGTTSLPLESATVPAG